jgi:hypothetical protein
MKNDDNDDAKAFVWWVKHDVKGVPSAFMAKVKKSNIFIFPKYHTLFTVFFLLLQRLESRDEPTNFEF